ncbi:hypothetical protein UJ101_00134 [Flavobacteriaceae bacterium UJ101]|nr:hypothetical protein UJ101_00134 [Flavobacteriaceae bacterium UJ101]
MKKNWVIHNNYKSFEKELKGIIDSFADQGDIVMDGERNLIKKFKLSSGLMINIKSFKKPHLINQFSYAYIRPSKAKRSYENAGKLIQSGVLTPLPIAYIEFSNSLGITNSYYISGHVDYDFTYRELLNENFPDRVNILKQFTHFTYQLHENQIDFLDHSPGNTLIIEKENKTYDFYLIDLNRMDFKEMNLEDRMANFRKLSAKDDMIRIMSDEYAQIINKPSEEIYNLMKNASDDFQKSYQRRMHFKAKFLGREYS